MLSGKKIALFGCGSIASYIYSGADVFVQSSVNSSKSDIDFDILKITDKPDYTTLIKAYRNVQKKYYPEKDIVIKQKNILSKRNKNG